MSVQVVTGGAGFIGSHLVKRLVQLGHTVRVIDDLSTGDARRLAGIPGVAVMEADLATADVAGLLTDASTIFHLAAVPSVSRSVEDPERSHRSVATGTLRLLAAARRVGIQRIVLSSSSSVYGDTDVTPKHEGLEPRPISPYAVAKLAAESYARVFSRLFGMRTINLRYFNVFGPGQDPRSAYAAVIPRFIACALRAEPLPIFGDGLQTRDFTYVDNVVDANIAASAAPATAGVTFNIAGGRPHSVLELVEALEAILGRRLEREHRPERHGDIKHSHAAIDAARVGLGWSPRVDFRTGLARTVEWFRDSGQAPGSSASR